MTRLHISSSLQARIIKSVALFGLALFVATISFSSFSSYSYSSRDFYSAFKDALPSSTSMSNGSIQGSNGLASQNDEFASFLSDNKRDFVKALNDGSTLEGWVIVMGELVLQGGIC